MALLGSSIDPSLFRQDYSGFVNAANTNANAMAGLGQTIAGGIERYGEEKQNRKKLDAGIKASVTGIESAIKMGKSLGIDIESSLSPYLQKINDPNISPIEAAAYAKEASNSISNVLNLGMEGRKFDTEQNRLEQQATLQRNQLIADEKAAMRAESRKPPTTQTFGVQGGEQVMVWNADTKSFEKPKISGGLVDIVKGFEGFSPNAYSDYKQTSVGYGTRGKEGEVLTESQATERLNTELSVHAKRIKDAAELKGVSLNENQFNALASFDFNTGQGASLIERFGDKPNELVAKMQEYTKAGGEDLPGLVNRRRMESALFLTPVESSVGFTPTKTEKQETPMSAEQVQDLAVRGFRVNARPLPDGSFMVTGADIGGTGETIESSPEGGFKITRGGGGGEKAEKATEARKKQQGSFVNEFVNTASETLKMIPKLPDSPIGAKLGSILGGVIPGTEIGRVVSRLGTLKANLALDKINQLREASPTGGAAGNMTVQEWPLFMQEFGSLDAAENKQDLEARLKNASVKLFNRVNGTPEQRTAALKDGIFTSEDNKIVEDQYNQMLSDLNISAPTAPTSSQSPLFSPETEATINKHLPK